MLYTLLPENKKTRLTTLIPKHINNLKSKKYNVFAMGFVNRYYINTEYCVVEN